MNLPRAGEVSWSWLRASMAPGPRLPTIGIDLGRRVPAGLLLVVCAVVAVGCTALVATAGAHWLLAGGAITTMVLRPAGAAPAVLALGVGVGLLAQDVDPFDPRGFALVLGLHLTVQLAAIVGDLPWSGAVEAEVLAAAARPFLAIQAAAQALALVAAWVGDGGAEVPWLPLVAGSAFAVSAWALAVRLDRPD